jgi:hypothetical protein
MNSTPTITPTSPATNSGVEATHLGPPLHTAAGALLPAADSNRQKIMMMVGSGLMLGTSLLVLNRARVFSPARFAFRTFAPQALSVLSQRLMGLSQELGERAGILERKPLLSRLLTGRSTAVNVKGIKQAQQKVAAVGAQAVEAIRGGLHETRLYSSRIAKDHPAATAGSGLFLLGLITAALMMPSYMSRSEPNRIILK